MTGEGEGDKVNTTLLFVAEGRGLDPCYHLTPRSLAADPVLKTSWSVFSKLGLSWKRK
jgi:hypothetical protein